MPNLLAIDCSTSVCSCALMHGNQLIERVASGAQRHSEQLLPMVSALLADAGLARNQLDALAWGEGPGSFTGLRIAGGTVQGLAWSLDVPVVGVSSLAALAISFVDSRGLEVGDELIAALDARMDEIYWAQFRLDAHGILERLSEDKLCAPEALQPEVTQARLSAAGSGWNYAARIECAATMHVVDSDCYPGASAVARLRAAALSAGKAVAADAAVPRYLRNNVAQIPTGMR